MSISKILKAVSLVAIGIGFTAADTVAPMITDAVTETDQMNNVDAATLPVGEGAVVDALPTPVNGQITDAVNSQITDAAVTNIQTPGVYINEQNANEIVKPQITDAVFMANSEGHMSEEHNTYRPTEGERRTNFGSKY